ncbi:glycosyltransferase family 2 protein [Marinibacterium profundimaris]|uniref:glycosyltransferase family 2 protein n=1 Tax=Marinibacterium profundimaris TaxID=1679460 RepID=UPI000B51EAA7|nr:glycosyltransferase family 2 protein [Marinibacterium profundimaris]
MPKCSIIVPAFNAAPTLLETLDSLLAQTFPDFEVILVDDGSTDATRRLAEAYCADPRMRVVRQINRGAAAARNTGIAAARGRYIGFCDADDAWHPEKLARHVAHLDANPDIGVSFSAAALVDEAGRPLGEVQRPKGQSLSPSLLFKRNPVGVISTVVARREALEDVSYRPYCEDQRDWVFDEMLKGYDDFECWLRMALTTGWEIMGLPDVLTRQRVSLDTIRRNAGARAAAWDQMVAALRPADPPFFEKYEPAARAHQLHFLTRSRPADPEAENAIAMMREALTQQDDQHTTHANFAAMMREAFSGGPIPSVSRGAPASWV